MRARIPAMAAAVVVAGAMFGASVRGQEPARPDVMGTLLVEVRALRGAIEQMTSATARVQLAVGRLQIQEQRFNTLARQLFELRQTLSDAERAQSEQAGRLADLEGVLQQTSDAGERQAIGQEIRQLKGSLAAAGQSLSKLRVDETELAGAVAVEQGRWSDLNQQLDAIDQALRR